MIKSLSVCLFFLLFVQLTSEAQSVVTGIVKNKSNTVLSGASVVALNTETNKRATTFSNDSGIFKFTDLAAGGPYDFIISYIGMQPDTLRGYHLKNDSRVTLSIVLEENDDGLNDMVVIGYGKVKKQDLSMHSSRFDFFPVAFINSSLISFFSD